MSVLHEILKILIEGSNDDFNSTPNKIQTYLKEQNIESLTLIRMLQERLNKKDLAAKWLALTGFFYKHCSVLFKTSRTYSADTSQRYFKKAAEMGEPIAQYFHGLFCKSIGQYQNASDWYKKSANSGISAAQFKMAELYACNDPAVSNGIDLSSALFWCQKAAHQGHYLASRELGIRYRTGRGVKEDAVKAAYWLKKGAQKGDGVCNWLLGDHYLSGKGIVRDIHQAIQRHRKSSTHTGLDKIFRFVPIR
ncbi:hypothetical protein G9A89_006074 [Geosiphon pyriformis]|nr:hypothetical protein G9A89_006074 [Geosiphon pyriformis]